MLTDLRVNNYKSFGRMTHLPLRRLTVLLGKNNSGKTAAARLPLFLFAAVAARPTAEDALLPLHVRGLRYASNLQELAFRETPHSGLAFGYSYTEWGKTQAEKQILRRLDVEVQLSQSISQGQDAFVANFNAAPLVGDISWSPTKSTSDRIEYDGATGFQGLLPVMAGTTAERYRVANSLRRYAEVSLAGALHLRSTRAPLRAVYETRPPELREDTDGSQAPYLLSEQPKLLDQVSSWYRTRLGLIGVSIDPGTAAFQLMAGSRSTAHNLARAGQGIQQALPVVTYLMALRQGLIRRRLVVIEEPELHLHPSAHGGLSDLAIETLNACPSMQMVVETHSENYVLRIRRRVADGQLSPHDVVILWFETMPNGLTRVHEIEVRSDGSVSDWPSGVFAEDLEEVRAITRAGRA